MQIIAGPTGVEIAKEIASLLGTTAIIPEFKIFPDGESYIRLPEIEDTKTLVIQTCYYPQDSNLFQLLNLINTIDSKIESEILCYIPYLCYARSDRRVLSGEAISINTVLKLLESVGVDHLLVLDIHNPDVLDRTRMNTTNIFPTTSIHEYLDTRIDNLSNLLVIAPDAGALDRAKFLANELGVEASNLEKTRDPLTGKVSLTMGEVKLEKDEIIIVDDIISTGGTLVEASQLLKINGATKIHYVITHVLGTEAVDKLYEIGNGIVVATNSTKSIIGEISTSSDLIRVLDL